MVATLQGATNDSSRYAFIGQCPILLSDVITTDFWPTTFNQDSLSIGQVANNCLWNCFPELMTAAKSFVPTSGTLLVSPVTIILDNVQNFENRTTIHRIREEVKKSDDTQEIELLVASIFSKLPVWKILTITLDLKQRSLPGTLAQRIMLLALEHVSEIARHGQIFVIPNRRLPLNREGERYLTFRHHLYKERGIVTRIRGMRQYNIIEYESMLSPKAHIFILEKLTKLGPGYLSWTNGSVFATTIMTPQGVEVATQMTSERFDNKLRWVSQIRTPMIFDVSTNTHNHHVVPIMVKAEDLIVLTFVRKNTDDEWVPSSIFAESEPG